MIGLRGQDLASELPCPNTVSQEMVTCGTGALLQSTQCLWQWSAEKISLTKVAVDPSYDYF